jgi:hypothetical protein
MGELRRRQGRPLFVGVIETGQTVLPITAKRAALCAFIQSINGRQK